MKREALAFWLILCLKWVQKRLLDPLLLTVLGYSTRDGFVAERTEERCAQEVHIYAKGAYSPAIVHTLGNFLYAHEAYVCPQVVLKADNITLMGVDRTRAWFCITDKDVNVYDLTRHPFVWVAQYALAKKLIIMPIGAFLRLAQLELPDPGSGGKEVIMMFNTARCGSTLLCQMFHRLPRTRSMSEPWAATVAHSKWMAGQIQDPDHYANIIQACIRMQCKPEHGARIDRIFFKQSVWASAQIPIVRKMCPNVKLMFCTRHPKPSLVSLYQLSQGPVMANVKYDLTRMMHRIAPLPYNSESWADFKANILAKTSLNSMDSYVAIVFALAIICYSEHREDFSQLIVYEDLLENPQEKTADMLGRLGIDAKHAQTCLLAMSTDSQKKFFGRTDGAQMFTNQQLGDINRVFKRLNSRLSLSMTLDEFRALLQK